MRKAAAAFIVVIVIGWLVTASAQTMSASLDSDSNTLVLKWASEVFRIGPDEIADLHAQKQDMLDRIAELEVRVGVLSGQVADQSALISRQNYMLNRLYDLGIVRAEDVPGGFTPTVAVTP